MKTTGREPVQGRGGRRKRATGGGRSWTPAPAPNPDDRVQGDEVADRPTFAPDPEAFYGDYNGISAVGGRVAALCTVFTGEGEQALEAAVFRFRGGSQEALEP